MKILKRLKDKLKDRAADAGIGALIIGLVTELLGVDIAPTEIDAVVTGVAVLAALYGRWRERRRARRVERAGTT